MEGQKLVELQKKIGSFEKQRVKTEQDKEVNEKSSDNFKKKVAREKEELLKKLKESEKLTQDMADMTQEKIMKSKGEIIEAKRSETELTDNINRMRTMLTELENKHENEMTASVRMNNKIISEKNNAVRSLEVMKNASVSRNADYDREIQFLADRINNLEQEKAAKDERIRVLREQLEQGKAASDERIRVLSEQLEREDIGENVRSNIEQEIEVLGERNNELTAQVEREIEEIEERNSEIDVQLEGNPERMSLREKIKSIFKKHGFTITAILLSISAIVTNSLSAVSKMATSVANGLKAIGKKLAQILPGMIGAIASFIFRTAGQVVGFLAKNAWILVVAVVIYFVESLKKKNKR